jgi:hypothetical protein
MKRIVTGVNAEGRSHAVSVEELDTSRFGPIWDFNPDTLPEWMSMIAPDLAADWLGPQVPGGMHWSIVSLAPAKDIRESVEHPGIDKDGFHTTRTIDFDLLLAGELTLVLEEQRVRLLPGDCVVQQATRHAWVNEGDAPALMVALLHRPPSVVRS